MTAAQLALQAGKSVVIDNTNPDIKTRAIWIDLAKQHGATARCIHLTSSERLCKHNNWLRVVAAGCEQLDDRQVMGDVASEPRSLLPAIAFNSYRTRFESPSLKEGFATLQDVPFAVDEAINQHWRRHYD